MKREISEELTRRFTEVWVKYMIRDSQTAAFRRVAKIADNPSVHDAIVRQHRAAADWLINSQEGRSFLIKKKGAQDIDIEKVATGGADSTVHTFKTSVDAASLLWAHSSFESAIYELCEIIAELEPEAWMKEVELGKQSLKSCEAKISTQFFA